MSNKENQEHIKIYDKYMYTSQEKFKTFAIIIFVFVLGFVAGYFAHAPSTENTNNNVNNTTSNVVTENK